MMEQQFDPKQQRSDLRENVPPELQDAYDRIVGAGMKFMFDASTHESATQFLQQEGPIDEKLSAGIAYLMAMLMKKSNGSMPPELIIPAGIDLMLQAAEFAQETGIADVTPADLANAMQKFVFLMAKKAGMSEEQVIGGIGKLQQMAGAK